MKYEVSISILDKAYIDQLIVALVRQGYSVYFNDEIGEHGAVYFTATNDDVTALKGDRTQVSRM